MEDLGLKTIDYVILVVYLLITFMIGIVAERWASKDADAFFLGGRKLPWWALGASGMASNVDISGTALAVGLIYAMGVQGYYIEIRGGIVLVMAILLAFMGKWNRRSKVMTRAEWMIFRFGDGTGGKFARFASAFSEILFAIWVTGYFAKGLEIFVGPLVPGVEPWMVSTLIVVFVMIYSMAGGLTGVIWTDVFQGGLIFVAVCYVCILAIGKGALPETFQVSVPLEEGFQTITANFSEWSRGLPSMEQDLPGKYADYNAFGFFIGIALLRTVIDGMAGSGGYMVQRYLAAKTEREAGLVSLFWIFLLMFRWPMVIGFAILGIHMSLETGKVIENPEQVLPMVMANMIPVGLKGLLAACFLAAFMSTLSSFLNSSAAYWTRDVYTAFINPKSTERGEVFQGRLATFTFVLLGLLTSYVIADLNTIWSWLTAALTGGIGIPLLLRWYWWRFNGIGFAAGTIAGNIFAVAVFFISKDTLLYWGGFIGVSSAEAMQYISVSAISLTACLLGTFLSEPTKQTVLNTYYSTTRPFGFWKKCRQEFSPQQQRAILKENATEVLSMIIAVPWQLLLFVLPMLLMIREWGQAAFVGSILGVLTVLLYFVWFKNLRTNDRGDEAFVSEKGALSSKGA